MPQRKGQFIVNYLRFDLKIPEASIGRYLFGMMDEDFEKIEQMYRMYVIEEIHKPERQARWEDLQMVAGNVKAVMDHMSLDEASGK